MPTLGLSFFSLFSLVVLMIVYFFLISEKLNKVITAMLGAVVLIFMQVFRSVTHSSQENAFLFISHNLDILFFVIGMMILVGIVKDSGIFEAFAIWLVKKVRGNPQLLLVILGYLTLLMTTLFSNIPTVLIVVPLVLILVRSLKLPYLPYLFIVVTMANLGGAMTPISDPTTYYQAKTVGLGFFEVLSNSGSIVLILSVISTLYALFIFRKPLKKVKVSQSAVAEYSPRSALGNMRVLYRGTPLLVVAIILMISKEWIYTTTGITLDNATIALGAAFLAMMIFHREPKRVFSELIDWEIIFFFMGLFVVVGALEFTNVIELLGAFLVKVAGGNGTILAGLITVGSSFISAFIDNVPYNITMIGAIQTMEKVGISVYPLWWALNLGTSIGGAGSPIAAACNVIAFGQAEKEGYKTGFAHYLQLALPLVAINSLIAFVIIWMRYL
jgi:Na+/H+ antiporter NhaD/arsenite permease-like protein